MYFKHNSSNCATCNNWWNITASRFVQFENVQQLVLHIPFDTQVILRYNNVDYQNHFVALHLSKANTYSVCLYGVIESVCFNAK